MKLGFTGANFLRLLGENVQPNYYFLLLFSLLLLSIESLSNITNKRSSVVNVKCEAVRKQNLYDKKFDFLVIPKKSFLVAKIANCVPSLFE